MYSNILQLWNAIRYFCTLRSTFAVLTTAYSKSILKKSCTWKMSPMDYIFMIIIKSNHFKYISFLLFFVGALIASAIMARFNKRTRRFPLRVNLRVNQLQIPSETKYFSTLPFQRSGGLSLPMLPPSDIVTKTLRVVVLKSIRKAFTFGGRT